MKSLLTWCVENNRQDIIKSYVLTNIYTMQDISYGSKKLAYWYCDKCKTVYTQAIQNKTIQNQNCPICRHRRLVKGINDFETFCKNHSEFSHLLLEWDYEENTLKPDEIFPNYTKTIAWKCKNGHTWKTSPNNRVHNKNNCKKCSEECRIPFAEKCENYKAVFNKEIPKAQPKVVRILHDSHIEAAVRKMKEMEKVKKLQDKVYAQLLADIEANEKDE